MHSAFQRGPPSVLMADGLAVLVSLHLVLDLNFLNIVLETDCLSIVSAVNEGSVPLNSFGYIILDIIEFLGSFWSSYLVHVPQLLN